MSHEITLNRQIKMVHHIPPKNRDSFIFNEPPAHIPSNNFEAESDCGSDPVLA